LCVLLKPMSLFDCSQTFIFEILFFRLEEPSVAAEPSPVKDGESSAQKQPEEPQVKKKKVRPPLPGGGMKREKTVVEKAADISDSKKQEMINMMMREQTSMAMKINKEQTRQEELVC